MKYYYKDCIEQCVQARIEAAARRGENITQAVLTAANAQAINNASREICSFNSSCTCSSNSNSTCRE